MEYHVAVFQLRANTLSLQHIISYTMSQQDLPPTAESLRKNIKELIPETATSPTRPGEDEPAISHQNKNGNKSYRGDLLAEKISLLTEDLRLRKQLRIGADWRWHLVHFLKDTKLENARKEGYLITLSEKTIINEGVLEEGCYIHITNEPVLSAGATVIFIVPPPLC